MDHRYMKFLVASLLLFCSPLMAKEKYKSLKIEGLVVFDDGKPFANAIVTATELRGRLFFMPSVKQKITTRSDEEGRFSIELSRVSGDLDISAKHETCLSALSSAVHLQPKDWHGKGRIYVELDSSKGNCEIEVP